MATTALREDYLGRDLIAPTSNSLDYLGRPTTATVDSLGRALRRTLRVNSTAYGLGAEIAFVDGKKFTVSVAGTTTTTEPAAPAVGATVADGTATLLRTKQMDYVAAAAAALRKRDENGGIHLHHRDCIHNLPPVEQVTMRGRTVEWWTSWIGDLPEQITPEQWQTEPPEW